MPIATYFAADKARDTERLALCFATDAHVHDESQDYHGIEAIQRWQQEAQAQYQAVSEPLEATINEQTAKVSARVTGNFPGSPIVLTYTFTLVGDKIAKLEIE
jgi:hypothetical protein